MNQGTKKDRWTIGLVWEGVDSEVLLFSRRVVSFSVGRVVIRQRVVKNRSIGIASSCGMASEATFRGKEDMLGPGGAKKKRRETLVGMPKRMTKPMEVRRWWLRVVGADEEEERGKEERETRR